MVTYRAEMILTMKRGGDVKRYELKATSHPSLRHPLSPRWGLPMLTTLLLSFVIGCDCRSSGKKFLPVHDSSASQEYSLESLRAQFGEPSERRLVDAISFRRLNREALISVSDIPSNFEGHVDVLIWREYCWFRLSDVMFAIADPYSGSILELKTFSVLRRPSAFERLHSSK